MLRNLALTVAALVGCPTLGVVAAGAGSTAPQGVFIEAHSCELFAGGCIVSSEATLRGQYMVRAWDFTKGSWEGKNLERLSLVVAQSSARNLAAPGSLPEEAVVYLPLAASAEARQALLSWARQNLPELRAARVHSRAVPVTFTRSAGGSRISAGEFVSLEVGNLEECQTGSCGEALWYSPRTPASVFTVGVNRSSRVVEPLLRLRWEDAGKRSVFVGRLESETRPPRNVFVDSADLCGPLLSKVPKDQAAGT